MRTEVRIAAIAAVGVGLTAGSMMGARRLLQAQAAAARRIIGKPLGEEAHRADRTYKPKFGEPLELLLLGDSIAAGLGAATPKQTLGAQLAKRVALHTGRAVRLQTAARVGAETSMLRAQLETLPAGYRPDVAVIVVGGNDVTHRVKVADSVGHLAEVVVALRERDAVVVVGLCPDLGALGALPQPLRALAGLASRQLAEAQRTTVTDLGAHAVSLARVVGPFFVARPDEMFSEDRFHPSGAGYRRTAKALLPSVLAGLGHVEEAPPGHYLPTFAPDPDAVVRAMVADTPGNRS